MKTNNNREIKKPKNIINEFPGSEVEMKFQIMVPSNCALSRFYETIKTDSDFSMVNDLDDFRWVFHFDYFAIKESSEYKQHLVIISHPSTTKFWIRKKINLKKFEIETNSLVGWVIKRDEETILVNSPFSHKNLEQILKKERKLLKNDLIYLGRLTREKYYTFLKNVKTDRTYSLSMDHCNFMGSWMSQLEIEYKWKELKSASRQEYSNDFKANSTRIPETLNDFSLMFNKLSTITMIKPTIMTKFDWLTSLLKG